MLRYERNLKKRGFDLIIGVDEVGRGPLAGPVVAVAVLLKEYSFRNRIDDSKKLSPAKRKAAFFEIKNKSLYKIASVSQGQIDRINILQATILAMQKAISGLAGKLTPAELKRAFVIIDGNLRMKLGLPYQSIIKGDAKSLSIAAASILAKVHRDSLMEKYHKLYPEYGFDKHKGYPTAEHRYVLKRIGPSAIHRKSFLKCLEKI
ncbi:MAG: ribonuclease HII [Candidatus Omnitrophica bacterium]|nr:ribonuclease HII [Candidatus Omnitrophota bacterium]MDD5252750.1 ribonuclease HII [Candidatus Omnitrophota bacterium]